MNLATKALADMSDLIEIGPDGMSLGEAEARIAAQDAEIGRLGASLLISQEKHKLAIKEMERQRDLLETLSADRLGDTAALRRMTTAFESMEQTCKDMQNPAKRSGPTNEPQVLQVQKEQELSE